MSKILQKRHRRQVARANKRVKLSEPDVRTQEQRRAAREVSKPAGGWRNGPPAYYLRPPSQKQVGPAADSSANADV
jgi:hypothetical protein